MKAKNAVIRCPIYGSVFLNDEEIRLIDNPFFQRLRYITQLGFASFVFPGAVHTRFSHSIGTTHLAGRVFQQILESQSDLLHTYYSKEQLDYFRRILRYASLLHDLGHLPFSHAAEELLPMLSSIQSPVFKEVVEDRKATHEDFSQAIIHHLAHEEGLLGKDEAQDIICLLAKTNQPTDRLLSGNGKSMIFPLLCQLINGEIDVDRMDYLLRDSYFAGVPYGKYDLDRLINSFSCCLEEKSEQFLLAIDGEGVPSYEIFLLARVHMFYQIYFHKSLGAYRHYLKQACVNQEIDYSINGSLDNFLLLTETKLLEEFRRNRDKKWSGKIFNRIPAKNLIRVIDSEPERLRKLNRIKETLRKNKIETILSHSSNQYSSQIAGKEIDQGTILVIDEELGKTTVVPLAQKSSLLGEREKQIEIDQLYVHREDYQKAIQLVKKDFE